MDEQIESKLIQEAAHELGIDVPIMSTRIVGNRLELYLYGGQVRVYTPPEMEIVPETSPILAGGAVDRDPAPPNQAGSSTAAIGELRSHDIADYLHPAIRDLEAMSLVDLRGLARRWMVPGWNRLNKAKLIDALRNARV
jgi:hypothetical protein